MYKMHFKLKLLLLVGFILAVALNVNDYWLIETLVRYVCTSCVGIG
jgi:hypothetical protein